MINIPIFLIQSRKAPHSLSCFDNHLVLFICLLTSVCAGMSIPIASLGECLSAYSTLKGFLTSVCAGMNSQMGSPGKFLLAYSTLKWFLTSVDAEVIIAVVLARKSFWTQLTPIYLLPAVGQHVAFQVRVC